MRQGRGSAASGFASGWVATRWLIAALVVGTGGCSRRLADPCAKVAGTCLAIRVEPSATVAEVDQLAVSVTGDGVNENQIVDNGKPLTLPAVIGAQLDSLPRSGAILMVTVDAIRGLQVDGFGSAGVGLSSGQHQSVTIRLGDTAPDMGSLDMQAGHGGHMAGDFGAAPVDAAPTDLAATDSAATDLGASPGLSQALDCVESRYVDTNECDWAHWSELYDVCHTYEYPAMDDGYLLNEVKSGQCSTATWPTIKEHILQMANSTPPVISCMGDALDCVESRYVDTNECDWAHWSELYEVCHTYSYHAMDDDYMLGEVKAGRCSTATWPAMKQHMIQTADSVPPVISTMGDSLDCVEWRYVDANHCDWAHWSELYDVCHTYAYPAMDDGYLLGEVKAGQCSTATWPTIKQHILQTAKTTLAAAHAPG